MAAATSEFMQQFKETKSIAKRSKKYLEQALYKRLFKDGNSEVSVRQNLNQFFKSRKLVYKWEVGHTLKELRKCGRFAPALKGDENKEHIAKRSKKYLEQALYKRLFKNRTFEVSVRQNLNQFFKSRKMVYNWEVGHTLKELRRFGRFASSSRNRFVASSETGRGMHAHQLSEVMEKEKGMNKTVSDQAIHLDLVAKTRGIVSAENYFISLPEPSKSHLTYGALLNCYCKDKLTEKAEALFEKMKELKLGLTSMPYNSLMNLYAKTGYPEKIQTLIQEMKASNIKPDCFTYNIWMRALASANDIYGVERVFDEIKRDGRVVPDWTTYSNLASIYVNSGSMDKAEKALKELEKKNAFKDLHAYQYLITLYGRTGNLIEVYRVWRSLRLAFPKTANISYLNMIQVLVNLKDLPGAEKTFREWESGCSTYDIRVANVMIGAYAKEGNLEKAEETKERARRRGAKPNAKTWDIFLHYYLIKEGEIKSAVSCVEKAISIGKGDGGKWAPSSDVNRKLMQYFEENKDVDGAENYWGILEKGVDGMAVEMFEALIRTYAEAGRKSPTLKRRMKMENIELGENYKLLIDEVCGE